MSEIHERRYFQQQVAALLGGGVEFVGEVGGADKLSLLADATCLLNPLGWPEPFGMVMIETLACGTPVVVTGAGVAPEVVEHGVPGYLADHEADMITGLRRAPALDRAACRHTAEARFSAGAWSTSTWPSRTAGVRGVRDIGRPRRQFMEKFTRSCYGRCSGRLGLYGWQPSPAG
jgi:glycosyltransferase involved in cell wall biosynthesis